MVIVKKNAIMLVFLWAFLSSVFFCCLGSIKTDSRHQTISELNLIFTALEIFRATTNRYPDPNEGLGILFPEYLSDKDALIDIWGKPYGYRISPSSDDSVVIEIFSYGADGVKGGKDKNKDHLLRRKLQR